MLSRIFYKAGGERLESIVESSGSTWIRTVCAERSRHCWRWVEVMDACRLKVGGGRDGWDG